jgi:hypothetical protein
LAAGLNRRLYASFFFLCVLLEVVPFFQHCLMLDKWHSLPPLVRFGAYAAFLVLQYFLSRMVSERKFGAQVNCLKSLIKEME